MEEVRATASLKLLGAALRFGRLQRLETIVYTMRSCAVVATGDDATLVRKAETLFGMSFD